MPSSVGVLRLGRMGDLVMTLPALAWLISLPALRPRLVTRRRWLPLLPDLPTAASDGPVPRPDLWLDLHRVPASRRVLRRLVGGSRAPRVSVHKESLRRRGLLVGLGPGPRWTWPERHLQAAERLLLRLGLEPGPRPDPIPHLPPSAAAVPGLLGLVPGAAHATKRWPLPRWIELARRWASEGPVRVFTGPGEEDLGRALEDVGAERWPTPLERLRDGLSACAVVVAGDTGPLHVAGALGRPVVALFGPTPPDAGFWIWGERGVALRPDSPCAPCSMHGGPRCPRGHHRCLADLPVDRVLAAARGLGR